MIASTGIICNIAYIPINWKDICIADMNELSEMSKPAFEIEGENHETNKT